ncbi:MAG TPA: ABC transporter permease [Bryobacteraceae bacterium]|jgi:ABC-2 type transport system permease protein|nr:ABC transporter permease [Bryobacteraceae bacterium]HXJ40798.1 ABC transporter permease [Bryobacteraceae bacterium]
MWERIREIVLKEFRQVFRHPRMRVMLFLPPLFQLIIFGYAVNLDVENVSIAWVDQDRTPASRELRAAFEGSGRMVVRALPGNEAEVQSLLDRGEVQAVVLINSGFARDIDRGRPTAVQILVDGTNSNTASLISSYASQIVLSYATKVAVVQQRTRLMAGLPPLNFNTPHVSVHSRVWFNPDLKSRNYFIPGVVTNIIMVVTVILTAMAIVREKEIGTMEQLMVTPIRPLELMIGKMIPFALIGLVDVVLVTAGALVIFQVPFRGSGLLLLVSSALFLLTSLGAGLFISTISQTQQQAMMSSFFFAAPTFMLSGFVFPIRNMPLAVQYFTYLNPLRYFIEIVRGIFLKGTGITILWPQMLALLIYGVTVMGLSTARFRKRFD